MKGQRPKPAKIALAEGDTGKIGRRKLLERIAAEPAAPDSLPKCPKCLTGVARWAWRFLARDLEIMGMDKHTDTLMLIGVCRTFALATKGESAAAWMAFRSLATEFPFSPAARARFQLDRKGDAQNDLMAELAKPRVIRPEQPADTVQ